MGGWQSAAPQHGMPAELVPPFDVTRPNIARAYDYLLGGKDNFAADRDLAERLVAIYPGIRQMVAENRRFLARALNYVLAQGIRQYIDLGAGLPTSPAVHEIVRDRDSTAAVVYVDNDPVVLTHLWALAATDRAAVEKVLPGYMPTGKGTAALVNLNTFPVTADPVQLQRVADLMQEGGMLARPLNVAPLVVR